MSKKHFIELADCLRKAGMMPATITNALDAHGIQDTAVVATVLDAIARDLADFCQSQNPRFDRARWLAYIAGTNGPNGAPAS